jgi:SPP1 gp7 family putative phage head morphogenesis protein
MARPTAADLAAVIGLPPADAIEYFKSKGFAITWDWSDLWRDAHARAFTVAKAASLDVLGAIREELTRALTEGRTLAQFRKSLEPRLRALGWWGKQVMERPDGTAELVQAGSVWRLRTIYRTNLQSAYMAGRWRQLKEMADLRPWWEYVAVMDAKTRASHAEMNGFTFRHDDPFWESFYPPNGFNCRCRVRAHSDADVRRRGIATRSSEGALKERWRADPRSGLAERGALYKGPGMQRAVAPDLGWSYNPGRSAWQPNLDAFPVEQARAYIAEAVAGPAFRRFWSGQSAEAFPMAVLAPAQAEALGTKSAIVMVQAETLAAVQRAIPARDITLMQELPARLPAAEIASWRGKPVLEFLSRGVRYRARFEVRADGRRLYLAAIERVGRGRGP